MQHDGPVCAVIVAGGMGTRMNSGVPKQFVQLKGKPVVQWCLECFNRVQEIDRLILVLPEDWLDEGRDKLINFDPHKPFNIVAGGETRQDSVSAGLSSIASDDGWVIIHDGARPAITPEIVSKTLHEAFEKGNAVCAVPSNDTLVRVRDGQIHSSVNRSEIMRIQTPQIFPLTVMRDAMKNAKEKAFKGTDDASLVRELGHSINLVEGSELNLKITRLEDLEILEALL